VFDLTLEVFISRILPTVSNEVKQNEFTELCIDLKRNIDKKCRK